MHFRLLDICLGGLVANDSTRSPLLPSLNLQRATLLSALLVASGGGSQAVLLAHRLYVCSPHFYSWQLKMRLLYLGDIRVLVCAFINEQK